MVPITVSRVIMGTESSDARPVFRASSGYLYCFSSSTFAIMMGAASRTTRPISESPIFSGMRCVYSSEEHRAAEITSSLRSSSTSMMEHTGESSLSATISAMVCRMRSR